MQIQEVLKQHAWSIVITALLTLGGAAGLHYAVRPSPPVEAAPTPAEARLIGFYYGCGASEETKLRKFYIEFSIDKCSNFKCAGHGYSELGGLFSLDLTLTKDRLHGEYKYEGVDAMGQVQHKVWPDGHLTGTFQAIALTTGDGGNIRGEVRLNKGTQPAVRSCAQLANLDDLLR